MGRYQSNSQCVECPPNTYKDEVGNDQNLCRPCSPAGATGGTTGGRSGVNSSAECSTYADKLLMIQKKKKNVTLKLFKKKKNVTLKFNARNIKDAEMLLKSSCRI